MTPKEFIRELRTAAIAVRRWPKWKQEAMRKGVMNISSGTKVNK